MPANGKLSETERKTLEHLRTNYPQTLDEIAAFLRQEKDWGLGESLLLVERLVQRGFLLRDPDGAQERYVPLPRLDDE